MSNARATPRTFGFEEEVVLLDPGTLTPVDAAPDVLAELDPALCAHREFLRAQLELSSPVFRDAAAAVEAVGDFRSAVAEGARKRGLIPASVGVPPGGPDSATSEGERYAHFDAELAGMRPTHSVCALHVHVGVANPDEGVRALVAMRPWLPVLLALSANSSIAHGADTGFASWRSILLRRFTTEGVPPEFADAADYEQRVSRLVGIGATFDRGGLAWGMRLSAHLPTVEVRVFDAQPTGGDSVALALLVRALVDTAAVGRLPKPVSASQELLHSAAWHAARHGLETDLLDPVEETLVPAHRAVERMLDVAGDALAETGDLERVRAHVDAIGAAGTGAVRLQRAHAAGAARLAEHLDERFTAEAGR